MFRWVTWVAQTRSFPLSDLFFPQVFDAICEVFSCPLTDFLLWEQAQNYFCMCLRCQIPWRGKRMLFSIHGIISALTLFPLLFFSGSCCRERCFRRGCHWFSSLCSSPRRSGYPICCLFCWKSLSNSLWCGTCWFSLTSETSIAVLRRCIFLYGNYHATRPKGEIIAADHRGSTAAFYQEKWSRFLHWCSGWIFFHIRPLFCR